MNWRWELIIFLLQELYTSNKNRAFDEDYSRQANFEKMTFEELSQELLSFQEHRDGIGVARKQITVILEQLNLLMKYVEDHSELLQAHDSTESARIGKSYWTSNYNPNEPIYVGSEVAYKPKRTGAAGEWFQCEVTKISADGVRFEVRDPEPDELGPPGGTFRCTWKELLLIPPGNSTRQQTPNYPTSTKVLARYPETTTFYPAMVIGNKRDGTCRLRFDGEEEVGKETEVDRRFVLPFPSTRRP